MVQKTSVEAKPAKGRPRGFDPEVVLDQARDTFWRHGFAGTSMDQISAATGLHKPSLYGAFGDKKQLFMETLNRYRAEAREQIAAALSKPALFESIGDMLERAIAMFTRAGCQGGCFMMNIAVPVAAGDPEVTAFVRDSVEALDRAVTRRFERAIEDGELAASADPAALARIVVTSHYELSMRARAGYSAAELRPLAAKTLEIVRAVAGITSDS
jgi:AcrR family transcriptional regulator